MLGAVAGAGSSGGTGCQPTVSCLLSHCLRGLGAWAVTPVGMGSQKTCGMKGVKCHTAHRVVCCALCLARLFLLCQAGLRVLLWALCSSWLDTPGWALSTPQAGDSAVPVSL